MRTFTHGASVRGAGSAAFGRGAAAPVGRELQGGEKEMHCV
ncbi:hypothetical protein [Streptomyces sp. NPDC002265]